MAGRDLVWRLAGAALLAGAGGTSLVHRQVLAAAADRPASAIEMALALASFVLAGAGIVMILTGARLRDAWRAGRSGGPTHRRSP